MVEASAEPTAGLPWAAEVEAAGAGTAAAVVAEVGADTAAAGGPGLEPSTGGGEDCFTLGRKLCPPRVFTMVGLEKERMGGGSFSEMFLE